MSADASLHNFKPRPYSTATLAAYAEGEASNDNEGLFHEHYAWMGIDTGYWFLAASGASAVLMLYVFYRIGSFLWGFLG